VVNEHGTIAPLAASTVDRPLVSVLTPCYNAARYLEQTIRSVQAQTFTDWEMIVVNAASTDESLSIAARFAADDARIRVLSKTERLGPGPARNLALEAARGRFIAFLDADDLWEPEKLERQIGYMLDRGIPFTQTGYALMDENGASIGSPVIPPETVTHAELLYSCTIGTLTVVYDCEALGKQSMPDILQSEDYALWLKLLKRTPVSVGLPDVLARYRIHPGSLSRGKLRKAAFQWKVYRQEEGLSPVRAAYYFVAYAFRGLVKPKNYRAILESKLRKSRSGRG
jgi:teichuronic acid biosynthesis glycosyltransferase TuaG